MASYHTVRIEPLNKDNFDTWKIQMEALLVKNDSWGYVTGEIPKPETITNDANRAAAVAAWEKEDRKARSDIILGISPTELKQVKNCRTSKEVWLKLASTYQSTGPARKATLLKQLTLHRMDDQKDIREHLNVFFDTVDKLTEMEIEINNDLLTIMLLYSLPSKFENFRCAIESRDNLPTPEALRVKIIEESDARKTDARNNSNAMVAKTSSGRKREKYSRRNDERESRNSVHDKSDEKGEKHFKYKCHRCRKPGHEAAECRTQLSGNTANKTEDVSLVASTTRIVKDALNTDNAELSNKWCLDSGCSTHLCKEEDIFTRRLAVTDGKVNLANDSSAEVKAKGDVSITTRTGGRLKDVTINDALLVPDLRLNLLSVSKITDRGYTVTFDKFTGKVIDKAGNTALIAERIDNLYFLREVNARCNAAIASARSKDAFNLWHRRMGHVNARDLMECARGKHVRGIKVNVLPNDFECEVCLRGKMTRTPFPKTNDRQSKPLEIIHTDVWGPMKVESNGGARYFITFIDDHSRWVEIQLIKSKDEALSAFKRFKLFAEKQTGHKIKHIQSDNGTEYRNRAFDEFLEEQGISRRLTVTHTSEQNGVAERRNRTLVETARCLLIQSGLPPSFWGEAVNTANYIRNRCPSRSVEGKTPFEMWTGRTPDVRHLREFGCIAYTFERKPNKGKFDDRSKKGVLVGYSQESKAYRIWIPEERRIDIARDVKFLEHEDLKKPTTNEEFMDFDDTPTTHTRKPDEDEVTIPIGDSGTNIEQEQEEECPREFEAENPQPTMRGRGRPRIIRSGLRGRPCKEYQTQTVTFEPPEVAGIAEVRIKDALSSPEAEEWLSAIQQEIRSVIANDTWTIVDRPKQSKVIGSRIVLRNKYRDDGALERRKARLVAKGCSQRPGIDCGETFAPVARMNSVRIATAFAAINNASIHHFDVTTAYLNSDLNEEVFMEVPDHMNDALHRILRQESQGSAMHTKCSNMIESLNQSDKVLALRKAIYGLRQAGRRWHEKLSKTLRARSVNE